jgi:UDP-N-acetylmuramyl pentapeptide synthase
VRPHFPRQLLDPRTVRHSETKEVAVEILRANPGPGDVLLLKASVGMGLGAVVAEIIR